MKITFSILFLCGEQASLQTQKRSWIECGDVCRYLLLPGFLPPLADFCKIPPTNKSCRENSNWQVGPGVPQGDVVSESVLLPSVSFTSLHIIPVVVGKAFG